MAVLAMLMDGITSLDREESYAKKIGAHLEWVEK